jgi:phosphoribosylformylglycinamidine synthase
MVFWFLPPRSDLGMQPGAIILHAPGTNRDLEAAQALELAGARAEVVPLAELRNGRRKLADYQMMVVPGGFSYADALGAGKLFALDLTSDLAGDVRAFVASGKPVLGICNGFQALLKAGLLGGEKREMRGEMGEVRSESVDQPPLTSHFSPPTSNVTSTLTFNQSGRFECRWVTLAPRSQRCVWTRGLSEALYCPVAHGEGNFTLSAPDEPAAREQLAALAAGDQIALVYAGASGGPAEGAYPFNPNGSAGDIAGLCNPAGNVLGLMPHPEDHLFAYQHPRWARGERGGLGLRLFEEGVRYAAQL